MEETKKKKLGLASWIFIAMILGIVYLCGVVGGLAAGALL